MHIIQEQLEQTPARGNDQLLTLSPIPNQHLPSSSNRPTQVASLRRVCKREQACEGRIRALRGLLLEGVQKGGLHCKR